VRQLAVDVHAEQIETSQKRDSSHCMIADAIKAAYPKARNVVVDLATIRFTDPDRKERLTFLTPMRAQLAIIDFDRGEPLEPYTLTLKHPAKVQKLVRQVKPNRQGDLYATTTTNTRSIPTGRKRGADSVAVNRVGDIRIGRRRIYGLRGLEK
jgi:hypothetical protein